jgi:hypothetical protein
MKWLTIPQIKRRSKTAKGALKVSYEHWCQLYDATAKELRAEYQKTEEELIDADYCGLCCYYGKYGDKCNHCIFNQYCPPGLWWSAFQAFNGWYEQTGGDWHSWKRACKAVRDKLKELMEQS